MEKIHKNQTSKARVLPKNAGAVPAGDIQADEVERVLEHISSPFRWELLEVMPVQKKSGTPKKKSSRK